MRAWFAAALLLGSLSASAATLPWGGFTPEIAVSNEAGDTIGLRTAHFESGRKCDVYLRKGRENGRISDQMLKLALGDGGYVVEHRLHMNPAVNCHGFTCQTLGTIPYLPEDPWINPRDMIMLLAEYYANTGIRYSRAEIASFARDPRLQKNDLVTFETLEEGGGVLQHSGIVRKSAQGENWVLSKLDEDMVAFTPVDGLVKRYGIDRVRIFRLKNP